jgi:hypothetical protein
MFAKINNTKFRSTSLKGNMKLNKIKKNKTKARNKKFRKLSLFELQNSPKALLFRVRA